jgi:hypothetical protein
MESHGTTIECASTNTEHPAVHIECAATDIECAAINIKSEGTNIECTATNKIVVGDMATISFDADGDLLPSLNLGNIGSESGGALESFAV